MSKNPAVRARYREERTKMIEDFCKKNGFHLKNMNQGYQLRIENVIDVYPTNGRWCWLPTKEWGDFDGEDDLRETLLDKLNQSKATPETQKEQLNALDSQALLRPVGNVAKDLGLEMPRKRYVRQPQEDKAVSDYFCIRIAFCGSPEKGQYPILGLGSDDRIYKWQNGEWVEL